MLFEIRACYGVEFFGRNASFITCREAVDSVFAFGVAENVRAGAALEEIVADAAVKCIALIAADEVVISRIAREHKPASRCSRRAVNRVESNITGNVVANSIRSHSA